MAVRINQTSGVLSVDESGNFDVWITVTDAQGLTDIRRVAVNSGPVYIPVWISAGDQNIYSVGDYYYSASDGTPPYYWTITPSYINYWYSDENRLRVYGDETLILTVTDSIGDSDSITININLLSIVLPITNYSARWGNHTFTATGGVPPYYWTPQITPTYDWYPIEGSITINENTGVMRIENNYSGSTYDVHLIDSVGTTIEQTCYFTFPWTTTRYGAYNWYWTKISGQNVPGEYYDLILSTNTIWAAKNPLPSYFFQVWFVKYNSVITPLPIGLNLYDTNNSLVYSNAAYTTNEVIDFGSSIQIGKIEMIKNPLELVIVKNIQYCSVDMNSYL